MYRGINVIENVCSGVKLALAALLCSRFIVRILSARGIVGRIDTIPAEVAADQIETGGSCKSKS